MPPVSTSPRISRIENGVQAPTEHNIRDRCTACGAEDQIPDLIATAQSVETAYLEWARQSRADMRRVGDLHAIATIGFCIFDNNAVALETPTAAIKVTRPQEIALYAAMFTQLHDQASYGHDARHLIAEVLASL